MIPLDPPKGGQIIKINCFKFLAIKTKSPQRLCASAGMLICALPHLLICPFGDLVALIILRGRWFAVQDIVSGFLCFGGCLENKFAVCL